MTILLPMFHRTRLIKIIFWVSLFPLALSLAPIKLLPEDNWDWLWSRLTVLNRADSRINTLIAGPSFIMEGIHPSVFDATAHSRGIELRAAKISAGALSLAELDYLLRQLNEPALSRLKLVIIDVSFRAWDRLPDNRFTQRSLYWSDWPALKLTARFTDWDEWDSQWGGENTLGPASAHRSAFDENRSGPRTGGAIFFSP